MIYSFLLFSTVFIVNTFAQEEAAPAPFPTNINGNIGLQGNGYGDVYGGKVKEGVYGAGGRVGGGLNLLGTLGLGRKKRQSATAGAYANANGADAQANANAVAISGPVAAPEAPAADAAPADDAASAESARRRRSPRNQDGFRTFPLKLYL